MLYSLAFDSQHISGYGLEHVAADWHRPVCWGADVWLIEWCYLGTLDKGVSENRRTPAKYMCVADLAAPLCRVGISTLLNEWDTTVEHFEQLPNVRYVPACRADLLHVADHAGAKSWEAARAAMREIMIEKCFEVGRRRGVHSLLRLR